MSAWRCWLMPWRAARKIREQRESIEILILTVDRLVSPPREPPRLRVVK